MAQGGAAGVAPPASWPGAFCPEGDDTVVRVLKAGVALCRRRAACPLRARGGRLGLIGEACGQQAGEALAEDEKIDRRVRAEGLEHGAGIGVEVRGSFEREDLEWSEVLVSNLLENSGEDWLPMRHEAMDSEGYLSIDKVSRF